MTTIQLARQRCNLKHEKTNTKLYCTKGRYYLYHSCCMEGKPMSTMLLRSDRKLKWIYSCQYPQAFAAWPCLAKFVIHCNGPLKNDTVLTAHWHCRVNQGISYFENVYTVPFSVFILHLWSIQNRWIRFTLHSDIFHLIWNRME